MPQASDTTVRGGVLSLSLALFLLVVDLTSALPNQTVLLLIPQYALQRGMQAICLSMVSSLYDATTTSTLWHFGSPFMEVMYALVVQVVLYMSLGVYFERVLPGDVGVASSWTYPFQWLVSRYRSWRHSNEAHGGSRIEVHAISSLE